MGDLENNSSHSRIEKDAFKRITFLTTAGLSVLVFQVCLLAGPLYSKDTSTLQIGFIELITLIEASLFATVFGFLIGYRPVILIGFSISTLWPIVAQMSKSYESDALKNIALITKWLCVSVIQGMVLTTIHHFKDLGRQKFSIIGLLGIAITFGANMVAVVAVPGNWLAIVFGAYSLAMLILLYFTVPDTPRWLEEVSFTKLLPHVIGYFGNALATFVWLQYSSFFESWILCTLFLVACFAAGIYSLIVLNYGFPEDWKEESKARQQTSAETISWYSIE